MQWNKTWQNCSVIKEKEITQNDHANTLLYSKTAEALKDHVFERPIEKNMTKLLPQEILQWYVCVEEK